MIHMMHPHNKDFNVDIFSDIRDINFSESTAASDSLKYLILTEFAQCHVRDHLEDGTPQAGLLPSTVYTVTMS